MSGGSRWPMASPREPRQVTITKDPRNRGEREKKTKIITDILLGKLEWQIFAKQKQNTRTKKNMYWFTSMANELPVHKRRRSCVRVHCPLLNYSSKHWKVDKGLFLSPFAAGYFRCKLIRPFKSKSTDNWTCNKRRENLIKSNLHQTWGTDKCDKMKWTSS